MGKEEVKVSLRMPKDLVDYIDRVRSEQGEDFVSRSEMIRRLISFHRILMELPLGISLKEAPQLISEISEVKEATK